MIPDVHSYNEVNHNMMRRAACHNYALPGTYLITLTTSHRIPCLGKLSDNLSSPQIILSPLGTAIINEEIDKIPFYYTNVEVWDIVIMPDHIHVILHINEPFDNNKNLGWVIRGFKTGCSRAWWKLNGWLSGGKTPDTVAELPLLFEEGYNDRILMNEGQLERWKNYINDNPRRLAIKKQNPNYFHVKRDVEICKQKCQLIGNNFLLDIPDKMAVVVHRRASDEEFKQKLHQWRLCGERGGVLIGAFISQREKLVFQEAAANGYKIIKLLENGFPEIYKPSGTAFDACAQGILLQISPWEYHYDSRQISRQECLFLNSLAQNIANL